MVKQHLGWNLIICTDTMAQNMGTRGDENMYIRLKNTK